MTTERLDIRLDHERRQKLQEVAAEQGFPVSETVRLLIDRAYEDVLRVRRKRAAEALGQMEIEDVPGPTTLSRQLEDAHEPGGLS